MKKNELSGAGISLTNDGNLQFVFVGVGGAFTKRLNQTNLLIIKGDDHLLIDCGNTCPRSLLAMGLKVTDIRNFLITHSHADHIGGLEEVVLLNRYVVRQKPKIIITETYQHILWEMSLRGGVAYNEEVAGDMLTFQDMWEVLRPRVNAEFERETYETNFGSLNIKIMRTMHIPDSSHGWQSSFWSSGVIVDDRILFTSDTRYDPDLIWEYDRKYNFEQIFHDCQFFTGGVHASLDELNQFDPSIKERMFLVHYGDNYEDYRDKVRDYGFAGLAEEHTIYDFDA